MQNMKYVNLTFPKLLVLTCTQSDIIYISSSIAKPGSVHAVNMSAGPSNEGEIMI